jgi:DNA recombination protein RmuC
MRAILGDEAEIDHRHSAPITSISCPSRRASTALSAVAVTVLTMNVLALVAVVVLALAAGLGGGLVIASRQAAMTRREMREELRGLSAQAVADSSGQVLALADSRVRATEQVVAPVRESLDRLNDRLAGLERAGSSWQAQLKQQVESMHVGGEELRRETRALAEALRRPQVRGHWGEMQLRRALEVAGLTDRCTFQEQVSRSTDDGVLRPDVVVTMAGGKHLVIDAKVSLDGFLDATHARDAASREHALARHARQVRQHVDRLAAKAYWQQFGSTPEFVVMFLPAEAIFAQALETDPALLEYAAARQVVLATPTTLIAMLKTVGYAWRQETVAESAREVQRLAMELFDRLGKVGSHLDALGRSLTSSVASYNRAVGSLETRVLVTARRMRDLQSVDVALDPPPAIGETARPLTAPEFVDGPDDELVVGEPGREQWARRAAN